MTKQLFKIEYLSSPTDGLSEKNIFDALTKCDKCALYHKSEIIVKEVTEE